MRAATFLWSAATAALLATPLAFPGAFSVLGRASGQSAASVSAAAEPEDPYATASLLAHSAAIVEGTVKSIGYSYDQHTGPRTVVTLSVDQVHAGRFTAPELELRMFGGPVPDGRFFSMSASVNFIKTGRYLLFLENRPWFYTPLSATALRVDSIGEREVLTNPQGFAVRGLSPRGMSFSNARLFDEQRPTGDSIRTQAQLSAGFTASLLSGTLNRSDFLRLLREALASETGKPQGTFSTSPRQMPLWNIHPTEPSREAPTSASSNANAALPADVHELPMPDSTLQSGALEP